MRSDLTKPGYFREGPKWDIENLEGSHRKVT